MTDSSFETKTSIKGILLPHASSNINLIRKIYLEYITLCIYCIDITCKGM